MKIGVFGGSFDPPHKGHQHILEHLHSSSLLEKIFLVPSGKNLKKKWRVSPDLRERMMDLFLQDCSIPSSFLKVIWHQFREPDRISTTIELLETLETDFPGDEFSLVIGSDLVGDIPGWFRGKELLQRANFLVFPRPGFELNRQSEEYFRMRFIHDLKPVDVSSTEVVRALGLGMPTEEMLPKGVAAFIEKNHLYR